MPTTETLGDYGLDNVDCPYCHNTGTIIYKSDGVDYARECRCMNKRRSLRRVERSGMADLFARYTFGNYEAADEARLKIRERAEKFAAAEKGWFFIAGRSGSGKTHICTAICSRLIDRGWDVYYMPWRDESRALKALVNSDEIDAPLQRLKTVKVLYIDDFFKGGVTEADVRLAYEILNARYNNATLRTIISTELDLRELFDIDEAMAGRIYERAKGYTLKAPAENWRLK